MTVEMMQPRTYHATGEVQKDQNGVLVLGLGANTDHFKTAIQKLEASGHAVHFGDYSTQEPVFPVEDGRLHEVDTDEGKAEINQLLASLAIRAVYFSTPDRTHKPLIDRYLRGPVANGEVDFLVTTKPMVESREQLRDIRAALREVEAQLRARYGDDFDSKKRPLLLVHEHYLAKEPWRTLQEQLGEVSDRLGRLCGATVNIQEKRTAEDELRVDVVSGGAFQDLGPHAMSIALAVQDTLNANPNRRYRITDNSVIMDVTFIRHEESKFKNPRTETGFSIEGIAKVIDETTAETHDLAFTWCGGKGLQDKKDVVLEFEHPDTKVRTIIRADLITNTLHIPESVKDLFPDGTSKENGYFKPIVEGLNGNDPRESFQSFEQAGKVVVWGEHLANQGRAKGLPKMHQRGMSVQEVISTS